MRTQEDAALRRSSFFQYLPDEVFEKISSLLKEEHYEFGDVIVREGEQADAFFVLTSGRARALKILPTGEEIALGALRPGDSFGEAALAEGGTRKATVRCSTAVDLVRLDRNDFLNLVEQLPELRHHVEMTGRQRSLQGFLYQFSNFGRLPAPALRSMLENLTPMTCQKGGIIIQQGDPAGPMFILEKGRARAFLANNGKEKNLAFYRDGDYFGELSILNGSSRAASVEAFTDCQLLALEPNAVQDLKERFPEFQNLLQERLAQYQAKTEARIPLDFTVENLPAETTTHNKVALDGQQPATEGADGAESFTDEKGLFKKSSKRIFPAHWDPKLRIPRGQVVAAASIVSPKY